MRKAEALARIAENAGELHGLGVRALSLFGSVARDEATEASDMDLLVEFDRPVGLLAFVGLKQRLEEIMGCRVDLVTLDAIRPFMRERILREAVRAA